MIKDQRARETIFAILMWVVSVALASFLIGLGGLVIGDLPRVSDPVSVEDFVDAGAYAQVQNEQARLEQREPELMRRLDEAERALGDAGADAQAAQLTFDNWIAARTATTDPAQDPEVISRSRALEQLRVVERAAQQARDNAAAELTAQRDRVNANAEQRYALERAARPQFERAKFVQDLRVFALRLAFTLPLLLIAGLMLLQKKKGDYWPLQRGFVLFAAFAFFVELVPYLPEYGGYVRYGVGILITLLAGHFIIRWMRAYLRTRAASETKAEAERKRSIAYEDAIKKLNAKACPGCDRTVATTDETPPDFCVHCGMQLYNRCKECETRKFAFFRYCMKCGAAAQSGGAAA